MFVQWHLRDVRGNVSSECCKFVPCMSDGIFDDCLLFIYLFLHFAGLFSIPAALLLATFLPFPRCGISWGWRWMPGRSSLCL